MVTCRELIEREIEGAKNGLKSMKASIFVNQIVLNAFEKELEKYPKPEKEKKKAIGVG